MTTSRRGFFLGLGASLIVAPAIVKASNLMPVKVMNPLRGPHNSIYHGPNWPNMNFSIEKISVVARSRSLKAEYTIDMRECVETALGPFGYDYNDTAEEIRQKIDRELYQTLTGKHTEFTQRGLAQGGLDTLIQNTRYRKELNDWVAGHESDLWRDLTNPCERNNGLINSVVESIRAIPIRKVSAVLTNPIGT